MSRQSPTDRIRIGSVLRQLESSLEIMAGALSDERKPPADQRFYAAETPLAVEDAREALADLQAALLKQVSRVD